MCGGAAPNLFTPTRRAALCAASKLRSSYFKNTLQERIDEKFIPFRVNPSASNQ